MNFQDPKFIDENDPLAKTLYNIKTDIAFPKGISIEKQQNSGTGMMATSWSYEYESNMPPSLSLSPSPTLLNSKNYLKSYADMQEPSSPNPQNLLLQQTKLKLKNNANMPTS